MHFQRLTMISPYKAMWIIASFDLPTLTKKDRRYANNFRKDLLKLGFTKLQLSVYSYYASSKEKAEQIALCVKSFVPPNGHIIIMFLTDRQFAMTKNYYGGRKKNIDPPEQGLLLF